MKPHDRKSGKRRLFFMVGGFLCLLAVGLGSWFFIHNSSVSPNETPPADVQEVKAYSPPDAKRFEEALSSGDTEKQRPLLSEEFYESNWNAGTVVPGGKMLTIDQASFGSHGEVGWFVGRYKLPDGRVESETIIHLVYDTAKQQWLIKTFEGK